MKKLSHYDKKGRASMVDVSAKPETKRTAEAHAFLRIKRSVLNRLPENPKGESAGGGAVCRHQRRQEDV